MSNLIPERRTNKNGVTSTKWVKPSASMNPTSASIPIPVSSAQARKRSDLHDEVLVVSDLLGSVNDTARTEGLIRSNLAYVGEREVGILTHMKTIVSEHDMAAHVLRNLITRNGSYVSTSSGFAPELEIDTALNVIPLCSRLETRLGCDEFDSGSEGYRLIDSVIRVIDQEEVTGLDEAHTVALSMITFIRGDFDLFANDDDDDLSYDEVKNEVDFIAARLDVVEPLLSELKNRKAYDKKTIELLLNIPAKSISSGVL